MAKSKSNNLIKDGQNIKVPPDAYHLVELVKEKSPKTVMGYYVAEAIEEKTRREHPELIAKKSF